MKRTFYAELAYILGIIIITFGVTLMEKSDFGVSMIVAPAYVLHRKLVLQNPFFTFGVAEIITQVVVLLLAWAVTRKIKVADLFCFVTAVFYGIVLDGWIALLSGLPDDTIPARILLYVFGMLLCSLGVSLIFHTYVPPESYELLVKKVSSAFHFNINKTKTCFDLSSLTVALIMSFLFFGFGTFIGVRVGTLVAALFNGTVIGLFSKLLDRLFVFKDLFPLRKYCES